MMHADKWFPKTTQCPTCGATDIRDCRCDVLRAEKVIKELEAEVERLKEEVERLKEENTELKSELIVWEVNDE